jgi:plasmid stabilization system protein ParE
MIAARSGMGRPARVIWRRAAKQSLKALMDFLEATGCGDSGKRRKEIEEAVESLRHSPLRCEVAGMKDGMTFRRLVANGRFYVYYVFIPPRGMTSGGTLSIRSVMHAASQNPFDCVRDPLYGDQPHGVVWMHDTPGPLITA